MTHYLFNFFNFKNNKSFINKFYFLQSPVDDLTIEHGTVSS
jgi:hypothetical protein